MTAIIKGFRFTLKIPSKEDGAHLVKLAQKIGIGLCSVLSLWNFGFSLGVLAMLLIDVDLEDPLE